MVELAQVPVPDIIWQTAVFVLAGAGGGYVGGNGTKSNVKALRQSFSDLEGSVTSLQGSINGLSDNVTRLEGKVDRLDRRMDRHERAFAVLQDREDEPIGPLLE